MPRGLLFIHSSGTASVMSAEEADVIVNDLVRLSQEDEKPCGTDSVLSSLPRL